MVEGGRVICILILLEDPDDAGIVTEVGKGTITIRNDKGQDDHLQGGEGSLVNNSRVVAARTRRIYPSRFADVKPGCGIEVVCYTGETAKSQSRD